MKKTITAIVLGIFCIVSIRVVMSSSQWDERDDEEGYEEMSESDEYEYRSLGGTFLESREDVRPVDNKTYQIECGGCHFAYQPGLLPRQDWERIMDSLLEHYGEDASLDEYQTSEIRGYLFQHSAERASHSRSRAFAAGSKPANGLPRITQTRYFQREHYEIPARFAQHNTQVGSFSNCQACHRNADAGIYNEHQVVIPGVGKWDD